MKPTYLKLRGAIGIWRGLGLDEVEIDFRGFEAGLIAIVGANGCGKTSTIENLHPYLTLASRKGALSNHFRLKDSYRDFRCIMGGNEYRSYILIDAQSGKTEAYLYKDNEPLNDGKVSTYNESVEKVFGSEDLFFRSVFSAQRRESLVDATAGKRKELFYELLGLHQYDAYAEHAKMKADVLEAELGSSRTVSLRLQIEIDREDEAEKSIAWAQPEHADTLKRIEETESHLQGHQNRIGEIGSLLVTEIEKKRQLVEIEQKVNGNDAERNRQKVAQVKTIQEHDTQIAEAKTVVERHEKLQANKGLVSQKVARLSELEETAMLFAESLQKVQSIRERLADAKLEAEKANTAHQRNINDARIIFDKASSEIVRLKQQQQNTARQVNERVEAAHERRREAEKSASLINDVPCISFAGLPESCQLLKAAYEAQQSISGIQREVDEINKKAVEETANYEKLLQIAVEIEDAAKMELDNLLSVEIALDVTEYEQEIKDVGYCAEKHETVQAEIRTLKRENWEKAADQLKVSETVIAEKSKLIEFMEASKAKAIANFHESEARLNIERESLTKEAEAIRSSLKADSLENERRTIGEAIQRGKDTIARERSRADQLGATIEVNKKALETIAGQKAERSVLEEEIGKKTQQIENWRMVQRACSKDGIPALEIDASGGEVSRIANELLSKTFGTTFQIQFETTRRTKDKKKQTETFDIKVLSDEGEQNVENLSGGERTWIEKAIQEAVSIFMAEKSTREYLTTFADESDGALDPEKKQAFLDMMRESFRMGNRHYGLIITQTPDIWGQVQQRITFHKNSHISFNN